MPECGTGSKRNGAFGRAESGSLGPSRGRWGGLSIDPERAGWVERLRLLVSVRIAGSIGEDKTEMAEAKRAPASKDNILLHVGRRTQAMGNDDSHAFLHICHGHDRAEVLCLKRSAVHWYATSRRRSIASDHGIRALVEAWEILRCSKIYHHWGIVV